MPTPSHRPGTKEQVDISGQPGAFGTVQRHLRTSESAPKRNGGQEHDPSQLQHLGLKPKIGNERSQSGGKVDGKLHIVQQVNSIVLMVRDVAAAYKLLQNLVGTLSGTIGLRAVGRREGKSNTK